MVNVAYEDALAYAHWRGHELPTEAQWEFAARGGHNTDEEWSDAFDKDGKPIANSWQGIFPVYNTEEDGYARTAPVGCFKPNAYGLYDMIGNVWEWTSDWYVPGHPREPATNPSGPSLLQVKVSGRTVAEQSHQGRLISVCIQFLLPLSRDCAPAAGSGSGRGSSRLSHRAKTLAEYRGC